jgi:hypothetical protein
LRLAAIVKFVSSQSFYKASRNRPIVSNRRALSPQYNRALRRAFAIVLLALFSFSLIPMASSVDSTSKLPACCRGDGKHGCSMKKTIEENPAGLAIKGNPRCPLFPKGYFAPPGGEATGAASPHRAVIAFVVSPLTVAEEAENQHRISFRRGWQERGPPSLLS